MLSHRRNKGGRAEFRAAGSGAPTRHTCLPPTSPPYILLTGESCAPCSTAPISAMSTGSPPSLTHPPSANSLPSYPLPLHAQPKQSPGPLLSE